MDNKHGKRLHGSQSQPVAEKRRSAQIPQIGGHLLRGRSSSASKISVTIDSTVLRQTKVAAKQSGKTLSAHISQALERDLRRQRIAELISEFEAEHGAISPKEVARAIASWQG